MSVPLLGRFLFDVTGLLLIILTAVIGNGRNLASHCQLCDELNSRVTNQMHLPINSQDKVAIETNQYSGSSESCRIDFSKILNFYFIQPRFNPKPCKTLLRCITYLVTLNLRQNEVWAVLR